MPAATVDRATVVADQVVLEPGSPVVWFTFPGAWHDIGRFHTADGRFTGYYANILTPVVLNAEPPGQEVGGGRAGVGDDTWQTTDLFLDVFLDLEGRTHVLDRDELEAAADRGWVDAETVRAAETEAHRLVAAAAAGEWPPAVVDAWPLARARAAAEQAEG